MEENNFNNNDLDDRELRVNKVKVLTNVLSFTGGVFLSAIVLFALYIVVVEPYFEEKVTSDVLTQEQVNRISKAANIISEDYLYDYDMEKVVDGAIAGMVNSLDNEFTYYETEEEYQESLNSGSNANYSGIGVHLTLDADTNTIRCLGTIPNSPAEAAGILAGDLIIKVDDIEITKDTYTEGVNSIRGDVGTKVKLTILRGEGEVIELEVERATVVDNNVTSEIIDGIGYLRVYAFDIGVYDQFKEAYDKLRTQNIKGLIVDLRNNPGGYVSETVNMLDLFLPKGEILRLVSKTGNEKTYNTYDSDEIDIPLAVVVNQNSASASEIFASAIRDGNKGVVVGTQTFGKGVVQTVRPIKGHGAIDIVSAQYFTNSGVVIQGNGITPDFVVEVDEEYKNNTYISRDKDLQLQKAIEYIKEQL